MFFSYDIKLFERLDIVWYSDIVNVIYWYL